MGDYGAGLKTLAQSKMHFKTFSMKTMHLCMKTMHLCKCIFTSKAF